jgi:hypothetical protein
MNTRELIHLFNSQTKAKGRCGNVFFEGSKLYDYGHHYLMAHILPNGVALINSKGYSITTAKHTTWTRSALSNRTIFEVPYPINPNEPANRKHLENSIISSIESILSSRPALGRYANADYGTMWAFTALKAEIAAYNDFCLLFDTINTLGNLDNFWEELEAIAKANDARTIELKAARDARTPDEVKAAQIKRDQIKEKKFASDRQAWMEGRSNSTKGFSDHRPCLRIKDNYVQTTRGASVPLNEALELFKRIELGLAKEGDRVGSFTFNGVNNEQEIMIGCHRIDIDEAKRVLGPVTNRFTV